MNTPSYRASFRITDDHASLPGHFPGHPLVPGVVLLEQLAIGLRAWRNQRLARVIDAKFLAPLRPGEPAELLLEDSGERLRFEIRRADTLLARGTLCAGTTGNDVLEIDASGTDA
jgi:3-hydroxymyristoyl/3-hydroxydecanoyl-(acyl carrier protein) dehydratase